MYVVKIFFRQHKIPHKCIICIEIRTDRKKFETWRMASSFQTTIEKQKMLTYNTITFVCFCHFSETPLKINRSQENSGELKGKTG